jgi:hypothetical protein
MLRRVPHVPLMRALATAACVLSVVGMAARSAQAATVTVFDHNGRTHVVNNRFLTGDAANPNLPAMPVDGPLLAPAAPILTLSPIAALRLPLARAASAPHASTVQHKPKVKPITFAQALLKLEQSGALPAASYQTDLGIWRQALGEQTHLAGWRAAQLGDVTATLNQMAADKLITADRLPVLLLTLSNNAEYWKSGAPLANGAAVQFQGSELVWEYYAGSGIQLQVLHTFGEGDGYYEAGSADYPKLVTLMNEMVPLAVRRGGGIAWEYYFNWDGGKPPWVSAMAQATGLEALTNAYLATKNQQYLTDAHNALPLLATKPPVGVAVPTALGTRYLQYSFTPGTDIINAFLQTLLGLYDYQQVSLDPLASTLYNEGNAQAQAELSSFVVPGWSLYQPGEADPLNYHQLVTGFLKLLCQKTQIPVYCTTYQQFAGDLLNKPQLTLITTSAAAAQRFSLRFRLNKYAVVGVTLSRNGRNYLYTKQSFFAGTRGFSAPKLKLGTYELAISVTDPAGHYGSLHTSFSVCRSSCPPSPYSVSAPSTGAVTTVTIPLPPPLTTTTGTTTTPTTTTTTTTATTTTTTTTTGTAPATTTTATTTNPTTTGTNTTGGGGL